MADVSYPSTHKELDARAEAAGLSWPEGTKTVAQKQAALEAAGIGPAETEQALVLADTVSVEAEHHFGGFPGVWLKDRPIALAALAAYAGVDKVELYQRVIDEELPLELVDVELGAAPIPADPNRIVSDVDIAAGRAKAPELDVAASPEELEGEPTDEEPAADAAALVEE